MAEVEQMSAEHDADGVPENSQNEETQEHREAQVTGGGENRWPGWPGESVFRMLVPAQKVGSIIGRKGELIKKMCEETKARIKILDGPPGTAERANFMADAAAPAQPQTSTSMEQGYNPYGTHSSMYASPPNTSYGSVYGANYGY